MSAATHDLFRDVHNKGQSAPTPPKEKAAGWGTHSLHPSSQSPLESTHDAICNYI
jgi:hypothetical protein